MSSPYIAEIRLMSFNYAPRGWALCNGQTMSISQNSALFALIGTTFGGDGRATFMLPNLQGRVPLHYGDGFNLGENAGAATHALAINEMPSHNHSMKVTAADGTLVAPTPSSFLAQGKSTANGTPAVPIYSTANPDTTFAPGAITNAGGGQAHENRQPYLVLNFCIALNGIYPSRN
jgi:microcystin-dependent protein